VEVQLDQVLCQVVVGEANIRAKVPLTQSKQAVHFTINIMTNCNICNKARAKATCNNCSTPMHKGCAIKAGFFPYCCATCQAIGSPYLAAVKGSAPPSLPAVTVAVPNPGTLDAATAQTQAVEPMSVISAAAITPRVIPDTNVAIAPAETLIAEASNSVTSASGAVAVNQNSSQTAAHSTVATPPGNTSNASGGNLRRRPKPNDNASLVAKRQRLTTNAIPEAAHPSSNTVAPLDVDSMEPSDAANMLFDLAPAHRPCRIKCMALMTNVTSSSCLNYILDYSDVVLCTHELCKIKICSNCAILNNHTCGRPHTTAKCSKCNELCLSHYLVKCKLGTCDNLIHNDTYNCAILSNNKHFCSTFCAIVFESELISNSQSSESLLSSIPQSTPANPPPTNSTSLHQRFSTSPSTSASMSSSVIQQTQQVRQNKSTPADEFVIDDNSDNEFAIDEAMISCSSSNPFAEKLNDTHGFIATSRGYILQFGAQNNIQKCVVFKSKCFKKTQTTFVATLVKNINININQVDIVQLSDSSFKLQFDNTIDKERFMAKYLNYMSYTVEQLLFDDYKARTCSPFIPIINGCVQGNKSNFLLKFKKLMQKMIDTYGLKINTLLVTFFGDAARIQVALNQDQFSTFKNTFAAVKSLNVQPQDWIDASLFEASTTYLTLKYTSSNNIIAAMKTLQEINVVQVTFNEGASLVCKMANHNDLATAVSSVDIKNKLNAAGMDFCFRR